ncbi:hypothetical protein AGJ35_08780 [Cronobacter dublinensis subsp. dublinensis]|nr:hypothetical protein [Cronobacter dublinensis subsp. dublinensis]EGT5734353.1 hypothetical protein [Cronobacter dublinensis subsp. dublinensis]
MRTHFYPVLSKKSAFMDIQPHKHREANAYLFVLMGQCFDETMVVQSLFILLIFMAMKKEIRW